MQQQIENTGGEMMYGYPIEHHEWAEIIIDRDLTLCNEFAELYQAKNEFWFEDMQNFYQPVEYTKQDFLDYLALDCLLDPDDDKEDIDEEVENNFVPCDELEDYHIEGHFANFIEKLEDEREPQEIYQWYIVGPWLAEKLVELGQPVLETDNHFLWGRTCFGQAIILDGTFQKLRAKLEKDIEANR